jgi:hypothetical protein
LGIRSVIVMGCWWASSLFVKLISHIMFCMYVCSKICVPLGICWLCINPGCFTPMLMSCGMLKLSAFVFFYVGSREDVYVEGSPLVSYIENNLKWSMVLMRVRSTQFDLERLVVFD